MKRMICQRPSVRLFAKDVDAFFFRGDLLPRVNASHLEGPRQAHDREIARDEDVLDGGGSVAVALVRLAERTPQQPADIVVAAFGKSLIVVAQVRCKKIAHRLHVAGVEVRRPFQQGRADLGLRLIASLRRRKRTGECRCDDCCCQQA